MREGVVRIGILGAARVVPGALLDPARQTPGVEVEAVAARSLNRARAFATAHGIPRAYGSYDEMLADPAVDAVYIALPPSLHLPWVVRALQAGKHVLCEKPLAPNADDAAALAEAAMRHGRTLLEGMHVRYLAVLQRQRDLVKGGEFGRLLEIDAWFRAPRIQMAEGDFRLRADMAGGSALDLGCYAVSCLRYVAGEEPIVTSVRRRLAAPGVDRWMKAQLRFPSGARGRVECGFRGFYRAKVGVSVSLERGTIAWDKSGLVHRKDGRIVREPQPPNWTFQRQLQAFARRIRGEVSDALPLEDSVATARVIDAIYQKAGLELRRTQAI
jgi:predicted dehydrogenase